MDFKVWKPYTPTEIPHCAHYVNLSDTNSTKPTMYYTCKYQKQRKHTHIIYLKFKYSTHIIHFLLYYIID